MRYVISGFESHYNVPENQTAMVGLLELKKKNSSSMTSNLTGFLWISNADGAELTLP